MKMINSRDLLKIDLKITFELQISENLEFACPKLVEFADLPLPHNS